MDNKEFDQMLKARFSKEAPGGQDDGWQKLSAMLPAAPEKRRALAYWKMAASVLLVLGLGVGFSILFTKENNTEQPSEITGNQDLQDKHDIGNGPTAESLPDNNQESTAPSQSSPQTLRNIAGRNTTTIASTNQHAKNSHPSAVSATTPTPTIYIIPPTPTSGVNRKREPNPATTIPPNQVTSAMTQKAVPTRGNLPDFHKDACIIRNKTKSLEEQIADMNEALNRTTKTTSIAFGGGMNYGALNTGYNVNISARHALSKHVFVEGSVAFLYNSQAEKSSFYAAQNFSPTRPAPGQISASKTTNPAASNFYYLSVNPAMGYQISKAFALSAGPDLQQRIASLGQDGTAIYTPGLEPRIIPQLDFGVTGKADFFISPKIETSILFRNGLNNLLKKPDMYPYLNRRYIQVQLNYNFLLSK